MLLAINIGNSHAQTSKIQAGAGLYYGSSEGSGFGIGANGYYSITPNIRAGIDFIYYLGSPENTTYWGLNFNGHYHFETSGTISPYLLAGLNVSNFSIDIDIPGAGSGSAGNSEIGLNIGGGAEYPLSFGAFFAEAKYVISNYDQFVIGAGLRFGF